MTTSNEFGHSATPPPPKNNPVKSRCGANTGRFTKGRSGNHKGRPRGSGSAKKNALSVLLETTVTVNRNGRPHEISMEEALQQRTFKDALAGNRMAIREVIKWIDQRETWLIRHQSKEVQPIKQLISHDPENADNALLILGIATPKPVSQPDIRPDRKQLLLEPWAVQMALLRKRARLDLSNSKQDDIKRCTRDPDGLVWRVALRDIVPKR